MGKFFPTATVLALLLAGVTAVPGAQASADDGAVWSVPFEAPTAKTLRVAERALAAAEHEENHDEELEAEPAATTPEIETEEFQVAGVSWEPDAEVTVSRVALRVRDQGTWTDWFELGVVDPELPGARIASEPVIAVSGDAVQAVVATTSGEAPEDLRVDLVRSAPDPKAAALSKASAAGIASNGNDPVDGGNDGGGNNDKGTNANEPLRPNIVTRAEWGADEKITKDSSRSSSLKAMYVHHTAGSNSYTAEQAPGIVRSIHKFHVQSNKWPDIGYHFLVDQFGTVYEGRRGSIDELIVGAQAGGYNTNTIGVSGLGNFHGTGVLASVAMENAIVQVLAWQADKWGLDPSGTVRLPTGGSTGSGTRWKPGELTDPLPVIRGHRATNYTACPGDDLDARLEVIREAVITAVSRPSAPAAVPLLPAQAPVRLPGTVTLKWKAVPGAVKYQVLSRQAGHGATMPSKWKVVRTTTTLRYVATLRLGEHHEYRVRAVDAAGMKSPSTTLGSVTRPVVSGKLIERSARAWKITKSSKLYRGRAFRTTTAGAQLVLKKAKKVREIWIVAASGPGHGRIQVQIGATKVRTISLAKSTYQAQRRIRVVLPAVKNGNVKITARDAGKLVDISGIALVRK